MKALICEYHRYDSPIQTGSHHLARVLRDRGIQVMWVPNAWTPLHAVKRPKPRPVVRHPDGVTEISVLAPAPYYAAPFLDSSLWGRYWLSFPFGNRSRLQAAGALDVEILWISNFTMVPLRRIVRAEKVVFRFFDHLLAFHGMPRTVFQTFQRFAEDTDLVLCSSRSVCQEISGLGCDPVYLPNGSDPDHFVKACHDRPNQPSRVVYVGAVDAWFDFDCLCFWAERLPHVQFDICGPINTRVPPLEENVTLLGPVAYSDLPDTLGSASVGIIPFIRSSLTNGVHPIKMYDYLAAGLPVLSSDLPEVDEIPGAVWIYSSREQGLETLRTLLDGVPDCEPLQAIARQNSWSSRLDIVLEHLGDGPSAAVGRS